MGTVTNITKNFTYAIANEEFSLDDSKGTVVNATYNGPNKMWVFIDEETNKLTNLPIKTEADNGEEFPAPVGYIKVLVDANVDTKIAAMCMPYCVTINDTINTVVEDMPDNETHEYQYPLDIAIAYDLYETVYLDGEWNTTYQGPIRTWEDVISTRNTKLVISDTKIAPDMPDAVKQPWIDYRQKLRDLPSVWAGIDPHKVQFPTAPDEE